MPLTRPKILLLGTIDHEAARKDWASLSSIADLLEPKATNREEFIKECRSGAFNGVVAVYKTFASTSISGRIDEGLIENFPRSLRFISNNGAGYDTIDVAACTSHNIHVSNVPTAVDDATADTAVFLLLGALRGFYPSISSLRARNWRGSPEARLGHDPEGKLLGIVGMGGIGRNLMKKAQAFGMKVQYYNRRRLGEEMSGGAQYVEFEELLRTSDVISLNLPLNKTTHHIISRVEFTKMKDGVVLVNTARGAVIDEAALVEALKSGKVMSCGLDVFEEEPKIHPGLLDNPNVLLLPHVGTATEETQTAMEQWNISNVRMAIEEGKLRTPVPEQTNMTFD